MQEEVIFHYNSLVDENNDPVHDPDPLKLYMDKWDGTEFLNDLEIDYRKTVLEIGVGTGRLAIKVCGNCGHFTGIDCSDKAILRAEENMQGLRSKQLICADFMTYLFDKKFDVIYTSLTFMHIEEKEKAIHKIAELLSETGRFVLSIEKTKCDVIDYGSRTIRTFPDCPSRIKEYLEKEKLCILKQYETEFAVIFVSCKVIR